MKSAGLYLVISAGSAGIQCQGWQKQWGFEPPGHTSMSLSSQGSKTRSRQHSTTWSNPRPTPDFRTAKAPKTQRNC